ncbi:MAG: hypothetical protein WBF42_07905 [Terracidiphilus sp.]
MAEYDELDCQLDAALSTYAEPELHLVPRVLAQVSAARSRRMRWFWGAGLASAAAAAALLLLIAPWHTPTNITPRAEVSIAPPAAPAPLWENSRTAHPAGAHARRPKPAPTLASSMSAPKENIFPAPRPLSAEEQALVHLVAQSSPEQRESLLRQQQQAAEPIRISAISIPPLSSPAEGKE